jgi:hypothetical protein
MRPQTISKKDLVQESPKSSPRRMAGLSEGGFANSPDAPAKPAGLFDGSQFAGFHANGA